MPLDAVTTRRLKRLVTAALAVWVAPRVWRFRLAAMLFGDTRAMCGLSERASRRTGTLGMLYRAALYGRVLDAVGDDVHVGFGTLLSKRAASLGDRVYLGRYCTVGWVAIGDDVHVADGAQLLSGGRQHVGGGDGPQFERIRMGAGAWIGAAAVVMADVGKGATVGAGAVVTRAVPDYTTVAGVPARPIATPEPLRRSA